MVASLGVDKIRITGGEPLLRRGVESLISQIAAIDSIRDLSLTTNGTHFPRLAKRLKEAGLGRVTLSLDSLDRDNFKKITGRDGLAEVLESIRLAKSLGLAPVKVNAVIIRGLNDHEIERLAGFAVDEDVIMRFIEFMPLDSRQVWRRDHVVSGAEITERIQSKYPLTPHPAGNPSETSTPGSSPRSRSRSAAAVTGSDSRRTAKSAPACSATTSTTSSRAFGTAPAAMRI